jgi:hypothetical protein
LTPKNYLSVNVLSPLLLYPFFSFLKCLLFFLYLSATIRS